MISSRGAGSSCPRDLRVSSAVLLFGKGSFWKHVAGPPASEWPRP